MAFELGYKAFGCSRGIGKGAGAGLWWRLAELVFQEADQVQPPREGNGVSGADGELAGWLPFWPGLEVDP